MNTLFGDDYYQEEEKDDKEMKQYIDNVEQ